MQYESTVSKVEAARKSYTLTFDMDPNGKSLINGDNVDVSSQLTWSQNSLTVYYGDTLVSIKGEHVSEADNIIISNTNDSQSNTFKISVKRWSNSSDERNNSIFTIPANNTLKLLVEYLIDFNTPINSNQTISAVLQNSAVQYSYKVKFTYDKITEIRLGEILDPDDGYYTSKVFPKRNNSMVFFNRTTACSTTTINNEITYLSPSKTIYLWIKSNKIGGSWMFFSDGFFEYNSLKIDTKQYNRPIILTHRESNGTENKEFWYRAKLNISSGLSMSKNLTMIYNVSGEPTYGPYASDFYSPVTNNTEGAFSYYFDNSTNNTVFEMLISTYTQVHLENSNLYVRSGDIYSNWYGGQDFSAADKKYYSHNLPVNGYVFYSYSTEYTDGTYSFGWDETVGKSGSSADYNSVPVLAYNPCYSSKIHVEFNTNNEWVQARYADDYTWPNNIAPFIKIAFAYAPYYYSGNLKGNPFPSYGDSPTNYRVKKIIRGPFGNDLFERLLIGASNVSEAPSGSYQTIWCDIPRNDSDITQTREDDINLSYTIGLPIWLTCQED